MKPLLALTLALSLATTAQAQSPNTADSVASTLPTAMLSAALLNAGGVSTRLTPQLLLAEGAVLSVIGVYEEGDGFSWLLERPSDGARFSVRIAGRLLDGVLIAPGAVVCVTAMSTGALLSAAGRALAFIPNESGKALFHHERISG